MDEEDFWIYLGFSLLYWVPFAIFTGITCWFIATMPTYGINPLWLMIFLVEFLGALVFYLVLWIPWVRQGWIEEEDWDDDYDYQNNRRRWH